jgi:uncharacterized membrane protein YdbT with pleckstrin-like domain
MSYVNSQLLPGESVQYRGRLHRIIFAPAVFLATVLLVVLIVSIQVRQELLVAALFALIAAVTFIWAYVHYSASEFAVTNKRVIMKVGWVHRHTLETLLSKVEGIGVDQGIVGRMLDYGTIQVTGTGGTKESFNRISSPLEFRRQVQAAISTADEARGQVVSGPARPERDCPFCAERILVAAKICKHCGRDVPPLVT